MLVAHKTRSDLGKLLCHLLRELRRAGGGVGGGGLGVLGLDKLPNEDVNPVLGLFQALGGLRGAWAAFRGFFRGFLGLGQVLFTPFLIKTFWEKASLVLLASRFSRLSDYRHQKLSFS